jgi:hypothetical protein
MIHMIQELFGQTLRQIGSDRNCYAQCRIRFEAIDVVRGFDGCIHSPTIPAMPPITIDFGI